MPEFVSTPRSASGSSGSTVEGLRRARKTSRGFLPFAADSQSFAASADAVVASATSSLVEQQRIFRTRQKAKRVRFFRNGDQFFAGSWTVVSTERFRCFDALLEELTKTIADLVNLPHGVRFIFSIDGTSRLSSLEDFKDGESYVCSSNECLKRLDYLSCREPVWSYSFPRRPLVENLLLCWYDNASTNAEPTDFVNPRIVTVIKNGVKPRKVARLLLNKKTAHSFNQVLSDITAAIKLDSGAVRKLFTLQGKPVRCLADFFRDDYVFIAYGSEKLSTDDFFLDSQEYKFLYAPKCRPSVAAALAAVCRDVRSQQAPGLSSGANGQSPLVRRKFLNQKQRNQKKLRSNKRTVEYQNSDSPVFAERPSQEELQTLENERHPAVISDRFAFGRLIGDGNFAVVYEATCRQSGQMLAMKVIDKLKCTGKEEMVESEVRLLRQTSHEFIVGLLGHWETDARYYLAMEIVKGGDLFDALVSVRHLPEREAADLMRCLASALQYLHDDLNILHRDVKPENLLVYEKGDGRKQLKLADFGLACEADRVLFTICGTPTYVAPEILAEIGYGLKVDVWAAGVIMYIMLCGFPPFVSLKNSQEELFEQILMGQYGFPSPYWDHVSSAAKGLIQGMLQLDVEDRYSASEVLMHPWVTGRHRNAAANSVESLTTGGADMAARSSTSKLNRKPFDFAQSIEYYYSRRRSMDDLSSFAASVSAGGHLSPNGNASVAPSAAAMARRHQSTMEHCMLAQHG